MSENEAFGAYDSFVRYALREGIRQRGHHNDNFLVEPPEAVAGPLRLEPGVPVILRRRSATALSVVIRTWQDESQILRSIEGLLKYVPECLAKRGDVAVLTYVEGVPLSALHPGDSPLDPRLIGSLAGLLAEMTAVRRPHLPELPGFWPGDGRSRAFLRTLAALTEEQVRRLNWRVFGGLFTALGVPENAMAAFAERVPPMTSRPFSLLHTDLHRDNVISSTFTSDAALICVDWELATYGDPLHDLATHLVRMRYPSDQWGDVTGAWVQAMQGARPGVVRGVETDVRHYIDFERAQSVYPDVMRAAYSLGPEPEPMAMGVASEAVLVALELAREPMRLRRIPRAAEIRRALHRWHAARPGRSTQVRFPVSTPEWRRPCPPCRTVTEPLTEGAGFAEQAATSVIPSGRRVPVDGRRSPLRPAAGPSPDQATDDSPADTPAGSAHL